MIICVYYDMTVARQYSMLKNEKLQYHTQLNNQYTILYCTVLFSLYILSVTVLSVVFYGFLPEIKWLIDWLIIHNLSTQSNWGTCGDKCLRWLCDIQLMGIRQTEKSNQFTNVDLKYVVLRVVEGTDDPAFVMNVELVCVQAIVGTRGVQGSQQWP